MAETKAWAIYSTSRKVLRKIVISDEENYSASQHRSTGESIVEINPAAPTIPVALQAIQTATGVVPASGRCAVINPAGRVMRFVNADPDLDLVPAFTLISSDTANVGDIYDPQTGEFTPNGPP